MTQSEKLAQSLEQLRELQKNGIVAIRSRDLTRTHLNRLTKNGFLKEVIKGWYIPCRPDEVKVIAPLGTFHFGIFAHHI